MGERRSDVRGDDGPRCRPRRERRRLLLPAVLGVLAVVLTGCLPVIGPVDRPESRRDEYGVIHTGPEPTAMTHEDGVEVWDLTVPPSAEAFGIDTDVPARTAIFVGAYSSTSTGPRPVRFLMPEGRELELDATEVIFDATDSTETTAGTSEDEVLLPEGRLFTLSVRAPGGDGPTAGPAAYRDVLEQLDLPSDSVEELERVIASPGPVDPLGASTRVGASVDLPPTEGVRLGVSTSFDPARDLERFTLALRAHWDPVPIP